MYRAPGAGLTQLCALESTQAGGGDLQSIYRASTVAEAEQHLAQLRASGKLTPA